MSDANTEAQAAADLGRLSTEVTPYSLDTDKALVVVRVRVDEQVSVVDLEEHLAARPLRQVRRGQQRRPTLTQSDDLPAGLDRHPVAVGLDHPRPRRTRRGSRPVRW